MTDKERRLIEKNLEITGQNERGEVKSRDKEKTMHTEESTYI